LTRSIDLSLPAPERRRAAGLAGRWRDLLYVPGPGFSSPLDPACYASSLVIVPADGPALRVSSFVVPAFGGELCRLRLESLVDYHPERLGSFFEPGRRGLVYAMSGDRRGGEARPPADPSWCYQGPSLARRLGDVARVRVLRERVSGGSDGRPFSWIADRALALTSAAGEECLLLSRPDASEAAVLVAAPGLYRALLDETAPAVPGAARADLLGYGDWDAPLDVVVEVLAA